ncbi:hypothetical protein FRX31_021852, partial [Thalictrum thalictroides]
VCGPEGKGRVRAASTGISRTSMLMSALVIEQVIVEKQKSMTIMEQVKSQGEQVAMLCKVVMELEQSVSQSSHRQPTESASSHARPPAMGSTFSVQRNDCCLSCFGGGVVAHGQVRIKHHLMAMANYIMCWLKSFLTQMRKCSNTMGQCQLLAM